MSVMLLLFFRSVCETDKPLGIGFSAFLSSLLGKSVFLTKHFPLPRCYFQSASELLPLISGKPSVPETVDSVVTCDIFWFDFKLKCDNLKRYL